MSRSVQDLVDSFFACYPTKTFAKGEHLILAHETPKGVMYIVDGQVRVYDISGQGDKVIVNILQKPAFFPMSWAISGIDNHYFYQAAVKTTVRFAPQADVIDFLHTQPTVTLDLLDRIQRGTDGLLERMARLMSGTAQDRLLFELVTTAKRFGTTEDDGAVTMRVTTQELADRTGLARETVSRELTKLKHQNFAETLADGRLRIPSVPALEALF